MMNCVTAERLYTRLEKVLPGFLDSYFDGRRDLAIVATRLTILVGQEVGLDVRPVVTSAYAANPGFVAWVKRYGRFPTNGEVEEHHLHLVKCAGVQARPDSYPFHLIAMIEDHAFDGTAGQFQRPAMGIFAPRTLSFRFDLGKGTHEQRLPGDCIAGYELVEDTGYQRDFAWLNARRHVAPLIRRLWPDEVAKVG